MNINIGLSKNHHRFRSTLIFLQVAALILAGFAPLIATVTADAAQLTSRKVTISTSEPSATGVGYDFQFSWAEATEVQGVILEFCTTALGTCVLPAGMNVSGATVDASAGFPGGSLSGTKVTSPTGECTSPATASATMVCLTSASSTSAAGTDATIELGGITNPSLVAPPNLTTVYVRVSLYDGSTFAASAVHSGTVAASINRQLTVNGRVQERLLFCVAAIDDGGITDTTLPKDMSECGAVTDTVIDLGTVDNTTIAASPVNNNPPASQGNDKYGIAMINTNASNGVAITYFAEPDTSSGAAEQLRAFRVPGAICNADPETLTDQCFRSAASTGTAFVAGAERFGINIPCIVAWDGGDGSANVNGLISSTRNLVASSNYDGFDGSTTSAADCENSDPTPAGAGNGNTYAWNDTGTAALLASSPTVVDNEIVKLNFAATASATTPTGAYTVQSTYIATATF